MKKKITNCTWFKHRFKRKKITYAMRSMIFKTTGDCSFTFAWNVQRLLLHFCKIRTFDFKLPKKIQYKVAMENFVFLLALFFINLEKKMNLNFLFKDLMLQNILNKFGKLDGMCVWTFGETKYCYIPPADKRLKITL